MFESISCEYIPTSYIIQPLTNDSYYKTNIEKLKFDVKSKGIKTFFFLLIFALVKNYEEEKDIDILIEFFIAKNNIDIFKSLKKICARTKKFESTFKRDLNMIIPFINTYAKNTFRRLDNEMIFYFPEIETDLINDFIPIQKIIESQFNSDVYEEVFKIISAFFANLMKNRLRKNKIETLIQKYDNLKLEERLFIKFIMMENYIYNHFFLYAIKKFMRHPRLLEYIKKQNKCCIRINNFIESFKQEMHLNFIKYRHMGKNLAMPIYNFGSEGNIMIIICLISSKKSFKDLNFVAQKPVYQPLYFKIKEKWYPKNFLQSAKKASDCYKVIKQFILNCNYYTYDHREITKKTMSLVGNSLKSLTNTSYFKKLLIIYDEDLVKQLKIELNEFLEKRIKNRII